MRINIGQLYDELARLHVETVELSRLEAVAGPEKIEAQRQYVEDLRDVYVDVEND